jgi:hypothetical protein
MDQGGRGGPRSQRPWRLGRASGDCRPTARRGPRIPIADATPGRHRAAPARRPPSRCGGPGHLDKAPQRSQRQDDDREALRRYLPRVRAAGRPRLDDLGAGRRQGQGRSEGPCGEAGRGTGHSGDTEGRRPGGARRGPGAAHPSRVQVRSVPATARRSGAPPRRTGSRGPDGGHFHGPPGRRAGEPSEAFPDARAGGSAAGSARRPAHGEAAHRPQRHPRRHRARDSFGAHDGRPAARLPPGRRIGQPAQLLPRPARDLAHLEGRGAVPVRSRVARAEPLARLRRGHADGTQLRRAPGIGRKAFGRRTPRLGPDGASGRHRQCGNRRGDAGGAAADGSRGRAHRPFGHSVPGPTDGGPGPAAADP